MSKKTQQTQLKDQVLVSRFSNKAIREQLDRILSHVEFHVTGRNREFLRYIVEETLAGRSGRIKGFSIAVEVFGRDVDFDASNDSVVRIQAGRLRRAIERYYLVAGMQDPIRIHIPKGNYVPVFTKGFNPKPPQSRGPNLPRQNVLAESSPLVLVMPFEDLTGKPECAYLGLSLATELGVELGHCADLRVIQYRESPSSQGTQRIKPNFTVEGRVYCDDDNLKVVAQLIDSNTGLQLWSDSLKTSFKSMQLINFQERVANSISSRIAGEQGVIVQTMRPRNSQRPSLDLTAYQAVLKGYAYWEKVDAISYQQAFEALRQAVAEGCDSGLCFSMMSLLYLDNISYEHFDLAHTPLDEALHMAREGARLEPRNQFWSYRACPSPLCTE